MSPLIATPLLPIVGNELKFCMDLGPCKGTDAFVVACGVEYMKVGLAEGLGLLRYPGVAAHGGGG